MPTTIKLFRFDNKDDYTYGVLIANRPYFILEDEKRSVKVKGETRIPNGSYEIKFREIESGLTQKYRSKFTWFKWHLELQDVPDFKYVYIHIGNIDEDTDGCLLIANTCDLTPPTSDGFVGESTPAYKEFYLYCKEKLESGERLFIQITDLS